MGFTSKQLKNIRQRQARERTKRLLLKAAAMDERATEADELGLLNAAIYYANLATTYRDEAKKPPAIKVRTRA